jgi:formylglycine-generating enzyme required for sulfatase activity
MPHAERQPATQAPGQHKSNAAVAPFAEPTFLRRWPTRRPASFRAAMLRGLRHAAGVFVVVGAFLFVVVGCTTASFGSPVKTMAPQALQDRSDMVSVDGGAYVMGLEGGDPDEYPPHRIKVATFLMDRTEVTKARYEECVAASVCKVATVPGETWATTPLHPVVGVSWHDAARYCAWRGRRLPTEAEWEWAARKGHEAQYPWGSRFAPGKANLRGDDDGFLQTAEVGSFPAGASTLGIVDLAGNVAEWVADWYDATWYARSLEDGAQGPLEPTGQKSVRGGSWADPEYLARVSARAALAPSISHNAVGFRCAATP